MAAPASLARRRQLTRQALARQGAARRALEQVTRATGVTASGLILVGVAAGAWLLGYVVGGRR